MGYLSSHIAEKKTKKWKWISIDHGQRQQRQQ